MARKPFEYRIAVEWSAEDDAFVARVPALGAAGHGETAEEAVREAQSAAAGLLSVMRKEGRPIPPGDAAGSYSGRTLLRMPVSMHRELALRAQEEGISLNQLLVALLGRGLGHRNARS